MLKSLHRVVFAFLFLFAVSALAQSDPPGRVGRLAIVDGDVGFRSDSRDQAEQASANWPISSGAILESGRRGRAEVWIGSTAYRLNGETDVEFPVVDDRRVDVRLNGGSLAVSILDRDQADDVVVATPDGDIRFQTPGRYRINVYGERTELLVQAGRASLDDGRRILPVAAGQMGVLSSDGRGGLDAARGYDAFDQWVANRENASLAGPARHYVSPYMTGYQDLDAYGDWRNTTDYGAVWYPRAVASDWAPYRYGRWAWVAPWGWTWIDESPWGFAPFHYGRWALIGGRWGWVPGRLVPRPVYAPALVGWVGDPGWSVSFSFGSAPAVGWFPLAPREVYVPAYRYSPNYVRQINVAHITNVTIIDRYVRGGAPSYANHAVPQAVTVVPSRYLREGRPISPAEVRHVDRQLLGAAPQARPIPNGQWLAPAPGASRMQPSGADVGRPPRWDFGEQRPNVMERAMPRTEQFPRDSERRGFRSPDDNRPRQPEFTAPRQDFPGRDVRQGMPQGDRSPMNDVRQPNERRLPDPVDQRNAPRPGESAAPVRPNMPDAGRNMASEPHREDRQPSGLMSPEREQRREMRERPRMDGGNVQPSPAMSPPSGPPNVAPREIQRAPEVVPSPAPMRRDMPSQDMRREQSQQPSFPMPEREPRRDVQREMPREVPRMERPVQQPAPAVAPQGMPQREMPRPMPEVRVQPPQPVTPQPIAPQAPPQPRAEPPRPQQIHQGGGGNEQHRRRDEERGSRN